MQLWLHLMNLLLPILSWYLRFSHQISIILNSGASPQNGSAFDFIVVGSGPGGSAVAGRIAKLHSVLLLEAGAPAHLMQGIPILFPAFQDTPYDWSFLTERQSQTMALLEDRRTRWSAGKALGGGSAINAMISLRGNAKDYDEWREMGNPGWGYQDVLPYFKKSETFKGYPFDSRYHGDSGPMSVGVTPYVHEFSSIFLDAAREMKENIGDLNGEAQDGGFAYTNVNLNKGWRYGAYRQYVEPHVANSKLSVLPFARVNKLYFEGNRAVAVEVDWAEGSKKKMVFRANKEVILSAGAVNSPQLLMLSGVGPREHLESLGIPVKKDLPVGRNLQDHIFAIYDLLVDRDMGSYGIHRGSVLNPINYLRLLFSGKGPLADNGVGCVGLIKTSEAQKRPDVEIQSWSTNFNADFGLVTAKLARLREGVYEAIYGSHQDREGAMLMPTVLHPKSIGFLELASSDPYEQPMIQPNYLTHPEDKDTLVRGLQFCHRLAQTETMSAHGVTPLAAPICDHEEAFSRPYFQCLVEKLTFSLNHPAGTCRMGPVDDPTSVVSAQLKVHGLSGLRVVDASIMPKVVGANPQATVVMIGEKAADLILREWSGQEDEILATQHGHEEL